MTSQARKIQEYNPIFKQEYKLHRLKKLAHEIFEHKQGYFIIDIYFLTMQFEFLLTCRCAAWEEFKHESLHVRIWYLLLFPSTWGGLRMQNSLLV